jgi:hypothetical protein
MRVYSCGRLMDPEHGRDLLKISFLTVPLEDMLRRVMELGPPHNYIAENLEIQQVGVEYVFVDDSHGSPVITSGNGRFGTWWPAGWI